MKEELRDRDRSTESRAGGIAAVGESNGEVMEALGEGVLIGNWGSCLDGRLGIVKGRRGGTIVTEISEGVRGGAGLIGVAGMDDIERGGVDRGRGMRGSTGGSSGSVSGVVAVYTELVRELELRLELNR